MGWSYSNYSTAAQCLRKYKLAVVDKIIPESPLSGDMVFGSALHSAINAVLTGQDGGSVFQLYWSSYKTKDLEYGRFGWEELSKLGAEFIRKFVKGHATKYKLEAAESRLYGEYKGVVLEGTPDYFGLYNDQPCLRDFKTSSRNYPPEKADCALQLYLYSYLHIRNGGKTPVTLGYTVFNKGTGSIQDLTWEFSGSKMYEALDDLVDYCSKINEFEASYPKNLNSCLDYGRKCAYYGICHPKEEIK